MLTTACDAVQTTGSSQTPLLCVCVCVCVCVFQREMKHSFSSKPDTRPTNIPLRSALFRNTAAGCSQSHHTAMIKHLLCGLVASRETGDYIYFTFEEFCWHSFPETYNDSINKISSKFVCLLSETRSRVQNRSSHRADSFIQTGERVLT